MKLILPEEIQQIVSKLIEDQKQKEKDSQEASALKKLKEREEKIARGEQLIKEIKKLTGLECAINQNLVHEEDVVEIDFECIDWGIILNFRNNSQPQHIDVRAFYLLSGYEAWGWDFISKQKLKEECINHLVQAKIRVDKNAELLADIEVAKPKLLTKIKEIEEKFWHWQEGKKITLYRWIWKSGHEENEIVSGWSLQNSLIGDNLLVKLQPEKSKKLRTYNIFPAYHLPTIEVHEFGSIADLPDSLIEWKRDFIYGFKSLSKVYDFKDGRWQQLNYYHAIVEGQPDDFVEYPDCDGYRTPVAWIRDLVEDAMPSNNVSEIYSKKSNINSYRKYVPATFSRVLNSERKSRQLYVILEYFLAIGIQVKKGEDRGGGFVWQLNWNGDKAGLFLISDDWSVASLRPDRELSGEWENYDLEEALDNNCIDLDCLEGENCDA